MAQRITNKLTQVVAELEKGLDYDEVRRPDVQFDIDCAVALTDRVEACATAKGKALTDDELLYIEQWLACWFYKGKDQQHSSKSTAGASDSFRGSSTLYLEDNLYGTRAKALDWSGCLATLVPGPDGKRAVAGGRWLGRAPSAQRPYWTRD